jgi:hypothetical protein
MRTTLPRLLSSVVPVVPVVRVVLVGAMTALVACSKASTPSVPPGDAGIDARPSGEVGAEASVITDSGTSPPDVTEESAPPDAAMRTDASCSAAGVTFESDWTADPAMGGWQAVQVVQPTRMHPDGTTTWHGFTAVRVEVDPGDDPLNLGENTERAEALVMQTSSGAAIPENVSSGTEYFATSYMFPSDWAGTALEGDSNSWSIVMQLHGPDALGASPAFALMAAKTTSGGTENLFVTTNPGAVPAGGCCGPTYPFTGNSLIALGKWTDLVFLMTFAADPTGHLTVWRRDQGQAAFTQVVDAANVATLQYQGSPSSVGDHYWKQGLYRGGDVMGRVDVLWIGPTARGPTFASVECGAFGTAAGP